MLAIANSTKVRMKTPHRADHKQPHDLIIITGLSGAGKTQAVHCLEDLGFYVVDNLPPALLTQFADLCARSHGRVSRIAAVMDIRGERFAKNISEVVAELQALGFRARLIFLEAAEEVLVRRFKETRRRHPLATRHRTLLESIRMERKQLQDFRAGADKIIDTTNTNSKTLKEEITALFSDQLSAQKMQVNILSFGYKYGVPTDADLLFDVRFLRNPHYQPAMQGLTGNDPTVQEYVMADPDAPSYLEKLQDLLTFSLPRYGEEGKCYLTVGVGCTGGRHRSVVFARLIADHLRKQGYEVLLDHRDMKK